MPHKRLTSEIRDRIGAYAMGLLAGSDARAFEQHVEQGCAACEAELRVMAEVLAHAALTVPPLDPPPYLRKKLMNQLDAAAKLNQRYVVRAGDAAWFPAGVPGVDVKRLSLDPLENRVTMLVRMEPGAVFPAHLHKGPEQCLVLEGDLTNDVTLQAGDFGYQPADTTHAVSRTENGCLLLIIASTRDELLL